MMTENGAMPALRSFVLHAPLTRQRRQRRRLRFFMTLQMPPPPLPRQFHVERLRPRRGGCSETKYRDRPSASGDERHDDDEDDDERDEDEGDAMMILVVPEGARVSLVGSKALQE